MNETSLIETAELVEPSALLDQWEFLKTENPSMRIRDAAARLGVSEAELVAARCGDRVKRLTGPWAELIQLLPTLGTVMALTRNDHIVHEKTGTFGNIKIVNSGMGLVLNKEIDLRLLMNHWISGFAVTEPTAHGTRNSLQFFDETGVAIHKIYQTEETDPNAWLELTERHQSEDQTPGITVSAPAEPAVDRPDDQIDVNRLKELWVALKDVHDFMFMLRKVKASRLQAMRLIGEDLAYRVTPGSFRAALEGAAETGLPIMVFVGSPGVIQIHSGPVEKLKEVGPWFNVLDAGFNLHLKTEAIASAWVVRKPTIDGIVTSLEIFDERERQIALMFGVRKEGQPERSDWRALINSLERLP